jgi:hypothetical protein
MHLQDFFIFTIHSEKKILLHSQMSSNAWELSGGVFFPKRSFQELLVREGEHATCLYYILRPSHPGHWGTERVLAVLKCTSKLRALLGNQSIRIKF